MTNGEKIRFMSDEELSVLLVEQSENGLCALSVFEKSASCREHDCEKCIEVWLKEENKDVDTKSYNKKILTVFATEKGYANIIFEGDAYPTTEEDVKDLQQYAKDKFKLKQEPILINWKELRK